MAKGDGGNTVAVLRAKAVLDTTDYERGAKRAAGATDSFAKKIFNIDGSLSKMANVAGKGLTALSAGMNAVDAAARGGTVNIAAMGTQLLGAFAMGGPVAAGVTLLTTGIGFLIGKINGANEATERLAETARKTAAIYESKIWKAGGMTGDNIGAAVAKARADVALRESQYAQTGAKAEQARLGDAMRLLDILLDQEKSLNAHQFRADLIEAARAKTLKHEEEMAAYLKANLQWEGSNAARFSNLLGEELTRVFREIEGTKAFKALFGGGGGAGPGVSVKNPWMDAMEEGHKGAPSATVTSDQWAEYFQGLSEKSKEVAAVAKAEADERERSARAIQQQTNAIRQQVDITRRFTSLPGSGGLFGFGAGQVGGQWSSGYGDMGVPGGVRRGKNGATTQGQGAGTPALPDLSPAVNGTTAAIKAIPAHWQRLGQALSQMQQAAVETLDRVGKATTAAVAKVAGDVAALRSRVKTIEDRLASAALGSGV